MAGRYAVPNQAQVTTPQVQTSQFQPQNLMQGYNYGQVANNMQQGYGTQTSAFTNMYNTNAQTAQAGNPFFNAGMGALGMGLGGWATTW